MIKKDILIFELLSTIFIIFLGFLLHFLYDWSGENTFIGIFSAINESTWEHLKLLFFPTLITIIIGSFIFKNSNYLLIKTKGLILGMFFIIVFFYTYTGILGYNIPVLDIGSFIVAVMISEYYVYKDFNKDKNASKIWLIVLLILTLSFIIFTFNTPEIGIFKDPITGCYGIKKKERFYLSN